MADLKDGWEVYKFGCLAFGWGSGAVLPFQASKNLNNMAQSDQGGDSTLNSDKACETFINYQKNNGFKCMTLASAKMNASKNVVLGLFIMLLNNFPFVSDI